MGFRQLQDPGGRIKGLGQVVDIAEGGFGGTTAEQSRNNISAVPVAQLDAINGIGKLSTASRFPLAYFSELGMSSSVCVVGPAILTVGKTSQFFISNYDMALPTVVTSIDPSLVIAVDKSTFTVSVPSDYVIEGPTVITVNGRDIVIDVAVNRILPPTIVSPADESSVDGSSVFLKCTAPETSTHAPLEWNDLVANERVEIVAPADAYAILVDGRSRENSRTDVYINGVKTTLGRSTTALRFDITKDDSIVFSLGANSQLRYAFLKPADAVTTVEWQASTDSGFGGTLELNQSVVGTGVQLTEYVASSLNDGPSDSLWIRCRHKNGTMTSDWSAPVNVTIPTDKNYRTYNYDAEVALMFIEGQNNEFAINGGFGLSVLMAPVADGNVSSVGGEVFAFIGAPRSSSSATAGQGLVVVYRLTEKFASLMENAAAQVSDLIRCPVNDGITGAFGFAMAYANEKLFVSDPVRRKVFIFQKRAGEANGFDHYATINGPVSGSTWGYALAAQDDMLLISDPEANAGAGKVDLYLDGQNGYALKTSFAPQADLNIAGFGGSLALMKAGTKLAVGCDCHKFTGTSEGKVFIFDFSSDVSAEVTGDVIGFPNTATTNMTEIAAYANIPKRFGACLVYSEKENALYIKAPGAAYYIDGSQDHAGLTFVYTETEGDFFYRTYWSNETALNPVTPYTSEDPQARRMVSASLSPNECFILEGGVTDNFQTGVYEPSYQLPIVTAWFPGIIN